MCIKRNSNTFFSEHGLRLGYVSCHLYQQKFHHFLPPQQQSAAITSFPLRQPPSRSPHGNNAVADDCYAGGLIGPEIRQSLPGMNLNRELKDYFLRTGWRDIHSSKCVYMRWKVLTDIWKSLCESWICFTWTSWDISKYNLGRTCR
jgi:hypothetical protein